MKEIIIKNLKIFAYHGVHQEEKIDGQNFYIDAVCKIVGDSEIDNIENTVSYSEIIKNINFRTLPIISSKLDSQFFVLYLSIYKMHV